MTDTETDAEFLKRMEPPEQYENWPNTLKSSDLRRLLALARRGAAAAQVADEWEREGMVDEYIDWLRAALDKANG